MTLKDRGIFLEMLAAAWESAKPGCLPLPLSLGAKEVGLHTNILGGFISRYPHAFAEVDGWLQNDKLRAIYMRTQEISEKRRKAAEVKHRGNSTDANAENVHGLAFAFAFADKTLERPGSPGAPEFPPNPVLEKSSAPGGFLIFWDAYPEERRGVKSETFRAWIDVRGAEQHLSEILGGLEKWKQSKSWTEHGGRFIPAARRFLAARQWELKPPNEAKTGGKTNGNGRGNLHPDTTEQERRLQENIRNAGFTHKGKPR